MGNWMRDVAERTGKIIPNEFSKLNAFSKFTGPFAPYLEATAGIDRAATAYGDTGDAGLALQEGVLGIGSSSDPGKYGSSGHVNKDIWNTIGQIGNYLPSPNPSGGYSMGKNPLDSLNDPYLFGEQPEQQVWGQSGDNLGNWGYDDPIQEELSYWDKIYKQPDLMLGSAAIQ